MKRFSVICIQCGLSVDRLIDAETAQTEIHPVTYQQKCKIAPNAADFDCPELERADRCNGRFSARALRTAFGGLAKVAADFAAAHNW
jgi:hypothetical protein